MPPLALGTAILTFYAVRFTLLLLNFNTALHMNPSMKSGICPKCERASVCEGTEVWNKSGSHHGNRIPISAFASVALDNYVCVACGYVESYVHDPAKLEKIARKWPRVEPRPEA